VKEAVSEWCLEHPWMTFFIAMALVNGISIRLNWRRKAKDEGK
jgi:hypothetical protein